MTIQMWKAALCAALVATPSLAQASLPLSPAKSCANVRAWSVDAMLPQLLYQRYGVHHYRYGSLAESARGEGRASTSSTTATGRAQSGPSNYTKTNNQVSGVDEGDIVKTDGRYIYTLRGNDLMIAKSWPAKQAKLVSRTSLKPQGAQSSWGQHLLLHGDKLLTVSMVHRPIKAPKTKKNKAQRGQRRRYVAPVRYSIALQMFDISDRAKPRRTTHHEIDGWAMQTRKIGQDVYVVSNNYFASPWYGGGNLDLYQAARADYPGVPKAREIHNAKERAKVMAEAKEPLRKALLKKKWDVSNLLPKMRRFGADGRLDSVDLAMSCRNLYLPEQSNGQLGMLLISHLRFDTPSKVTTSALASAGWKVYASPTTLYVAGTSWGWWNWGTMPSQHKPKTHIHAFDLTRADTLETPARYMGTGVVEGWLLNQFSMDEHKGHLRVATTTTDYERDPKTQQLTGRSTQSNRLTILRKPKRQGALNQVSSIEGLAKNERIYSVRFMGDRGYMVTFRQVDPLFTMDLSDPKAPKVVGELKINGFSSYIHPLEDGYLLTIGQDADKRGRITGMHLQIFDVRDMANPARAHQYKMTTKSEYGYSQALHDHKAFTFDPVSKTLSVPLNIYNRNWAKSFQGLELLRVDAKEGFTPIRRIDHREMLLEAAGRVCAKGSKIDPQSDPYWLRNNCSALKRKKYDALRNYNVIGRSIIIEDTIYSIGHYGIAGHHIRDTSKRPRYIHYL